MDPSAGLTQVLLNAQSQDERVRTQAEQFLRDFESTNLAGFMGNLCSELANTGRPAQIRQMAGLVLKNAVFAKDESKQLALNYRWGMIEEGVRNTIRGMLLATLGDPLKDARSTAALAIGKIAAIEIPRGQWHDLVDALAVNISNPASTPDLRQASLEALGFVCEECPTELAAKSSVVLGAIAFGMASDSSNAAIKLAATEALANSLNFVRPNFDIERDRDKIITMIFGVIKPDNDLRVRVAAFQCIVEIAGTYYNYLPRYFNDLFNLTGAAIQGEREEIALQAVEFWSTVAEEERTRREEAEEAAENGEPYELQNHGFTKACLPRLLPLILNSLTKQNEDFEDDTWNVAMAAGTCLGLMAQAVRDDIITLALPFIESNIQNPNWRFREAATLAFGFILDGPSKQGLTVLVKKAFQFFIRYLQDPDVHVKDTAAWTIGRVCEILPRAVEDDILPMLMEALVRSLADIPKVAANICWAIHNLAGAVDLPDDAPSSPLSRYFEGLLRALLQVTERRDADEHNLLPSAYEAISVLIQSAASDMYPLLISNIPILCKKLQSTFAMTAMNAEDRSKIADIQGHLCGTLQSLISKLPGDTVQQAADGFMNLFLMVLQTKTASAEEEALMAIGALANRVGANFIRYMEAFAPLLISLLQNVNRDQVCSVAIGVVGDVARALDDKLSNLPSFCDPVVQTLLSNLANQAMNRNLKPSIIAVLGDMAMALGGLFDRYLPYVMMVLNQASQLKYEKPTSDDQEYLAALRENILSAYTSIVQGLNAANKASLFAGFLPHIAPFLVAVGEEALANKDNYMLGSAVGLIGDIIQRVGPMAKASLDHETIRRMLTAATQSKNAKTRERGQWAGQMYARLLRMQ